MTGPTRDDGHVKDLVRQHWNGRASTFDGESQHGIHSADQRERWLEVLGERTGEDSIVLDVGCGTGVVSALLAELGHDVVGVDFAPEMLTRARTKARRTDGSLGFCRGDAETLPVHDGGVKLVTARHLVWTLPDPEGAIREWMRVLEPGGRLLLIEGYWDHVEPWDEYEAIYGDLPMYDGRPPEELSAVLRREGLSEVTHEPLMDPVLWGREPRHDYYAMTGTVSR